MVIADTVEMYEDCDTWEDLKRACLKEAETQIEDEIFDAIYQ